MLRDSIKGRKRLSEADRKKRVYVQIKHGFDRNISAKNLTIKGYSVEEVYFRIKSLFDKLEKLEDGNSFEVTYYKEKGDEEVWE